MNEQLEKRHRLVMAWNYEKGEQWLNELSGQGLHFKKGGLISNSFVRDESVRYTYRMDYQMGKEGEKLQEYLDLYQDAGWEYVSSFGLTWHYFRKEWQPGEEPQLYTDRESLVMLYKRLQQVFSIMMVVNLILMFVNIINLNTFFTEGLWTLGIPLLILYLSLFALLGFGCWKIQQKVKKLKLHI
ncbi:DUF2812 domain-containing protein [Paenibacillus glycanilyticus]|uniref:DUF2812 domain-containing protein n=1 Tax=Paenibacillus glycanilyticus TaxID=126569 RepID=UPI00203AC961|nr:DUF2812 domain-containing protein [Paenibacillus glycanilyticus]MCM3629627.1 DUF2812 domain-containing protein [Paenibacillus glycanilyticus]